MFWFERPAFLLFLLFVPVYFVLRKIGALRNFSLSFTFADWRGSAFVWKSAFAKIISAVCVCLATLSFVCAVLTAAGFSVLVRENYYSGTSAPVVFAVDISPSMSAPDMNGKTRFASATDGIRDFVRKRPGGSFGLVAFASEAAMLVPPTTDRETFLRRLAALQIGELGDGTAIGMGLAVAFSHLSEIGLRSSAHVILFTDGENNAGEIHPDTAATLFPSSDISLAIVGIGRRGVSEFSYEDPRRGMRYSGRLHSEFDESRLLKIASSANGIYIRAENEESLNVVFSTLENSAPASPTGWTKNVPQPLGYRCALLCLSFAALAWILRFCFLGGGICI